jgi:hypothetical protein
MDVRKEIEKYAAEEDKPVLRWLFERNHWASQWYYVAACKLDGKFPNCWRIWSPKPGGRNQYEAAIMRELLKEAPCTCPCTDGVGNKLSAVQPSGGIYHNDKNPQCFANRAKAFLPKESTP